jgi:hypothetical protein
VTQNKECTERWTRLTQTTVESYDTIWKQKKWFDQTKMTGGYKILMKELK